MNISEPVHSGSNGSLNIHGGSASNSQSAPYLNEAHRQWSNTSGNMQQAASPIPMSSSHNTAGVSSSALGAGSLGDDPAFMHSPLSTGALALDSQPLPTSIQPAPFAPPQQIVSVGFEEGTLRALCDLDCGFPLLMDRIKQSMASCRETSVFLKKRAQIEEDYARSLQKLIRERMESYSLSDGKGGSFVLAYNSVLRSHDGLAENRMKMSQQLSEMSEQLVEMAREVERSRKTAKELGTRLERNLTDSESQTEKARARFDSAVEDLERILLNKAGENAKDHANLMSDPSALSASGSGKRTLGKAIGKLKGGPKNPAQLQRMEEDARSKMNSLSDAYRQQVLATQTIRQEYFNLQLPRMLKSLKESLDEIDLGTQFHVSRYAFLFENLLLNDGMTVAPPNGLAPIQADDNSGLKAIGESIDNRDDFRKFMQNYAISFASSGQKVLRREGPTEEGFVKLSKNASHLNGSSGAATQQQTHGSTSRSLSGLPSTHSAGQLAGHLLATGPQYFGVDLGQQMERDGVEVPKVVQRCAETIEMHGIEGTGIYRLSGTTSRVQRLKEKMEKDIDRVDLNSDENLTDINDISGVLKLFFRELPDPLFTHELYHGFIEAAKIDNARLRHIRLHERINELPDPNYATCKFFLGHLDRIRQHESSNQMSISNLAIVFGPTLLGPPPEDASSQLSDMHWQYKALETILEHYAEIFIEAEEENGGGVPSGPPQLPALPRSPSLRGEHDASVDNMI